MRAAAVLVLLAFCIVAAPVSTAVDIPAPDGGGPCRIDLQEPGRPNIDLSCIRTPLDP